MSNKHRQQFQQNKQDRKKSQSKATVRKSERENKENSPKDSSEKPYKSTGALDNRREQQTEMPSILNAMRNRHDNIFEQVREEIGKMKVDFNARMDGLAKKVEKRVSESLTERLINTKRQ